MRKLLLASVFAIVCVTGNGQAGSLDLSFGNQGLVRTDFGSGSGINIQYDICYQVLLHPDGTFYLVFELNEQTFITHYLSNGALDVGYGAGGYSVPVPVRVPKAVLQADGKIVVGGFTTINDSQDFALARFNTNGTLDNSFSGDGKQATDFSSSQDHINALTLQSDGKIVAAGITYSGSLYSIALARYNPDGSPDNSFSGDGKLLANFGSADARAYAVTMQNDGKIVATGTFLSHFGVARYLPDGTPDNTFAFSGMTMFSIGVFSAAKAIAVQNDGKLVIAGYSGTNLTHEDFAVIRLNINGSLDNTFSADGIQTTNFEGQSEDIGESLAIQSDGKIVVAGSTRTVGPSDFALTRYNADGTPDNSFSADGKLTTSINPGVDFAYSLALQPDQKIIAAGWTDIMTGGNYVAVRYNPDGSLDNSFDGDGILTGYKPGGTTFYNASAVQTDGKIVAAGYTQTIDGNEFAIARYLTDGTPDNSFSEDGKQIIGLGPGSGIQAIAMQQDGKIVVAGYGSNGNNNDFALVRLHPDGSLDNTFSGDGKLLTDFSGENDGVLSMAIQPDGKIVVAGYTTFSGNRHFALARYNVDGSPDNSFSEDGKLVTVFNSSGNLAFAVLIQPDGKIVAAGNYNAINSSDIALVRYNTDGTPDPSFDEDGILITDIGGFDGAFAAALQPDGKIVVAGNTTADNGNDFLIIRFNTNGSFDDIFSGDGKLIFDVGSTNESAHSVALQPDGKIIVGGFLNGGNGIDFALARFNPDGTPDTHFAGDGIAITDFGYGADVIYSISIYNNRLYAAGYTLYGGVQGALAAYLLNDPVTDPLTVTIPDARALTSGVKANTVYIGYEPAADITLLAKPTGGTAPYLYFWSNGATTPSITVSPVATTTYSVTITDAWGFNTTTSKTVHVEDIRCGSKLNKVFICYGGRINSSRYHTDCVSANAVPAHLKNGATLGCCPFEAEPHQLMVTAFPNPSANHFTLYISSNKKDAAELVVWNAHGRFVERKKVFPDCTIQLGAAYPPGIYLLEVRQRNKKATLKLFKSGD